MTRRSCRYLGIFIVFVSVVFIPHRNAYPRESDPTTVTPQPENKIDPGVYDFHLGLKLGSLLPIGPVYKEIGFSIVTDLSADIRFAKYFTIGGFFTFFYTQRDFGEWWEEDWGTMSYTAIGGRLKVHIEIGGIIEIRPGLSLGWGAVQSKSTWDNWEPDQEVVSKPWGPHLDVSIEVSYYIRKHLGLLFDFGVIYYRGNGEYVEHASGSEGAYDLYEVLYQSFGHFFYFTVGVEYGGFF